MKRKLPKEQRIWKVCNQDIEEEIHLLIECDPYKTLRKPHLDICTELRSQVKFYTNLGKFIFTMTTFILMDDMFIHTALKERDVSLETKETLDSVLDKVSRLFLDLQ